MEMESYLIAFISVTALYIAYEIHRDRRRRGKNGIPYLGYIFDSVSLIVHEENLDEQCGGGSSDGSSRKSSKSRKKHSRKHRHHRRHKHHTCSKKHKHRKSKQIKIGSTPMELVEEGTQGSENADCSVKDKKSSSRALKKKKSPAKDSIIVEKNELVPASFPIAAPPSGVPAAAPVSADNNNNTNVTDDSKAEKNSSKNTDQKL